MNIVFTGDEVRDILIAYVQQTLNKKVTNVLFEVEDQLGHSVGYGDLTDVTLTVDDTIMSSLGPLKREILFGNAPRDGDYHDRPV